MPNSNYPFGWNNGVTIRGIPVLNTYPGNVFWVSSTQANASNQNPGTFNEPCATIAGALVYCTADKGDIIMVKAAHAETISAAAGIALSKAGVAVIGQGQGSDRPTITWATSTAATMTITAANVSVQNVVGICNIDQLVTALSVTAAGAWVDMEWQETADNKEAVAFLTGSAAANKLQVNLKYRGRTGGSHCVAPIVLNGSDGAIINLDFYGKASTAVVNFVTVACTNVEVYGYAYNSGDTTGAKLVVDTATGSTWYASINAGAAGSGFSGGSGAAMASDDVSTVVTNMNVPVADATTNTLERDVVGNKTDAAVYTPGTTKSILAYAKGAVDLQEGVAVSATATMVNGNIIFTVAGGWIQIVSLVSECITLNDATASTVQYQAAPTVGTATTFSGASASLANAAAGASVSLIGTALATAPVVNANGPGLGMTTNGGIIVPAGTVKVVIGTGSTTGTWRHMIRYRPLNKGVTVA